MATILALDYDYQATDLPWFSKKFSTYSELLKWLREDSIIVLPQLKLNDEQLKKNLILTKLALPRVKIILISEEDKSDNSSFFTVSTEENLEMNIRSLIINPLEIIDNRENLKKVLTLYS